MTFAELYAELEARGFTHLSVTRRKQIVNDAVAELDEMFPWPYREASGEGTAPLTVADLGAIEQVTNETDQYVLEPRTFQWLSDMYGDLSTSGNPSFYYVAWPSGSPVVATYPSNSDTIGVQYWRTSPTLSADGDEPLAPARFHQAYLLIAQRMAESERGNLAVAQGLQGEIDRMVARMVNALLNGQQLQGPGDVGRMWNADDC